VKLLDKTVAGLGALLAVCVVVAVGAQLVGPTLPLLVLLFGVALIYRFLWRGGRW
jgi:hypothetical protein